MDDSAVGKTSSANNQNTSNPQPAVAFNSADIGVKTTVKEDPFALQNKKAADKKASNAKRRKKIFLIIGIIFGLLLLGAVIFVVVNILNGNWSSKTEAPTEGAVSTAAVDISTEAQNIYSESGDLAAAEEVFTNAMNRIRNGEKIETNTNSGANYYTTDNSEQAQLNGVRLTRVLFFVNTGLYEEAQQALEEMNTDELNQGQRLMYYNLAQNVYFLIGDTDRATEYAKLAYNLKNTINQEAGLEGGVVYE